MKSVANRWIDRAIVIICVVSFGSWLVGVAGSPLFQPERPPAIGAGDRADDHDPAELALARAYWNRYPDVANHSYFGENGILGTEGARAHYQLHGKAEGRRWGFGPADGTGERNVRPSPESRCNEAETGRPNR